MAINQNHKKYIIIQKEADNGEERNEGQMRQKKIKMVDLTSTI